MPPSPKMIIGAYPHGGRADWSQRRKLGPPGGKPRGCYGLRPQKPPTRKTGAEQARDRVGIVGKRWNDPNYLAELLEAEGGPELIKFWRSPVFAEKFYNVPAFLLPRLSELATEVSSAGGGRGTYYARVHCLMKLASIAKEADPASFPPTGPPTHAERDLGHAIGEAFYHGCSVQDVALAIGLPADQIVAVGKRTIRRTGWLSRIAVDPDQG